MIVAVRRAGCVKSTKCLQVCGKKQLRAWLLTSCIPWHPAAARATSPDPLLNIFDHGDVETQHEDDEPQDGVWQAVFDNVGEVQKSALHPRLEAMSLHEGHRIFHHRSVMVCVKCGSSSMWVNRKLRRDCLGNPSKLGMEVLKRVANRETPRPGQEWPLSVDSCGESLSVTWATVCRARSRMALWVGGLGRGFGERMGLFPPSVRHCP